MTLTICDAKGRLYLKEELRKKHGDRFIAVSAPGEIILLPVPKDAVKDLQEATQKARHYSIRRLKELIHEAAGRQVVRS